MCWNEDVSLMAATLGWLTCTYLFCRGGRLDRWFGTYLLTFTLTQVVDIVLWGLGEDGLGPCDGHALVSGGPVRTNYLTSKVGIPLVVFTQHTAQCLFPSRYWMPRSSLILLHLIPCGFMAAAFACTTRKTALFPEPHTTLSWGGDFSTWPFLLVQFGALCHSGIVAVVFFLLMRDEPRVLAVHVGTLALVVTTLALTEGRLDLGSKWCTYCLIFSAVYVAAPLWLGDKRKSRSLVATTGPIRRED